MDIAGIVSILLTGLVAGWLASFVVGGRGVVKYILWGVIGAGVGSLVLPALGIFIDIGHPIANRVVVATIGAVLVVAVARLVR